MVQKIRKDRRDSLAGLAVSAGTGSMLAGLATGDAAAPRKKVTAQDVIDLTVENTTGSPLPPEKTVDTFKAGDPAQEVTGIVTTLLATLEVLKKAKEIGANLVITRESTYYNHLDKVDALVGDPVFDAEYRFITDLAVTHEDAVRVAGKLTVVVHNVGCKNTGEFTVKVADPAGEVLDTRRHAGLEGIGDLKPKTASFTFESMPDVALTVTATGPEKEITEVNNATTIARLKEHL